MTIRIHNLQKETKLHKTYNYIHNDKKERTKRPSLHCNTSLHFTTLHPTTRHYNATLRCTSPHFTQLHVTTMQHFAALHHTSPNYTSLQCNTSLHFTTLHPTTRHYTATLRCTSPHFTQLHVTTIQHFAALHHTSPNYTSLHCNTSLHFTTLHPTTRHYNATLRCTSPHFTQLHFTTLIDTSLPHIYTETWSVSPSVDMLPFGVIIPATVPQRSEIPEGLTNYPGTREGQKSLRHAAEDSVSPSV